MNTILLDLRYSLRTLLKTPTFTVAAVLSLAIGIGATAAVFSLWPGAGTVRSEQVRDSEIL